MSVDIYEQDIAQIIGSAYATKEQKQYENMTVY